MLVHFRVPLVQSMLLCCVGRRTLVSFFGCRSNGGVFRRLEALLLPVAAVLAYGG